MNNNTENAIQSTENNYYFCYLHVKKAAVYISILSIIAYVMTFEIEHWAVVIFNFLFDFLPAVCTLFAVYKCKPLFFIPVMISNVLYLSISFLLTISTFLLSAEEFGKVLEDMTTYEFDQKHTMNYKYIYVTVFGLCTAFYVACQIVAYRAYKFVKEQSELKLPIAYTKSVENCNFEVNTTS